MRIHTGLPHGESSIFKSLSRTSPDALLGFDIVRSWSGWVGWWYFLDPPDLHGLFGNGGLAACIIDHRRVTCLFDRLGFLNLWPARLMGSFFLPVFLHCNDKAIHLLFGRSHLDLLHTVLIFIIKYAYLWALLHPWLETEFFFLAIDFQLDFSSSNINVCIGGTQEWSPENERCLQVSLHV